MNVCPPFRNYEMAAYCAKLLEQMTGDKCRVVVQGRDYFVIMRTIGWQKKVTN